MNWLKINRVENAQKYREGVKCNILQKGNECISVHGDTDLYHCNMVSVGTKGIEYYIKERFGHCP